MTTSAQTDLSSEELTDAAVAVIEAEVAATLETWEQVLAGTLSASNLMLNEYLPVHSVVHRLKAIDAIREVPPPHDYYGKEKARAAVERKVKRVLDEEASKPDARILRFSSRDGEQLPRLNGRRRRLSGSQVAYTTPEFYRRAQEAVDALEDLRTRNEAEFTALLGRAHSAGLIDYGVPEHAKTHISINLDQMRKLVALLERSPVETSA